MREIRVHASSGAEALSEGAAALDVDPRVARVEILDSDEHGVTARVWVAGEPEAIEAQAGDEPEEPGQRAQRLLQVMLDQMGLEATVEVAEVNDDEIALDIQGEQLEVLTGSFGQGLNAVQFLLTIMVNRHGQRRRVVVDAAGYRQRRQERLEELAREHAARSKSEKREIILEGLKAAERRIIHMALQDDPEVVTYSEGEEPHRRLVIAPRS